MGQLPGAAIAPSIFLSSDAFRRLLNASLRQTRAMAAAALPSVLHWAVDWGPLAAAAGSSRDLPTRFGFLMQALDAGMDAERLCRQVKVVCRTVAHLGIIVGNRACDFQDAVVDNLVLAEEHRRAVELGI